MTQTHLVIMGVAGSGKTTLAQVLAARLGWPSAEADDFHPQANIDKMSAGIPLTDDDRWPWLAAIRRWQDDADAAGRSSLVTCSALKRVYRDALRAGNGRIVFVHLDGPEPVLAERLAHRTGHFMPPSLLPSQLATLEPLGADEDGLVLSAEHEPGALADEVVTRLGLRPRPADSR